MYIYIYVYIYIYGQKSTSMHRRHLKRYVCRCFAASSEIFCPSMPTDDSHWGHCRLEGVPAGDCASTKTAHPHPLGHFTRAPPPPGASSSCGEVRDRSASARSRNFSKSSADNRRLAAPWARTCLQPGTGQR